MKTRFSRALFLIFCFNGLITPWVFAANSSQLTARQSYFVAALILLTIALCIYLFFVMFFPEKF